MSVYTVHEPPLKKYESTADPDRFTFVRDRFHFWAFLLGPVWMLRYRLWLVLLGYLLVAGGLHGVLHLVGASMSVRAAAAVLLALLVGFEAATLRRFTLTRRGWKNVGLVVGDDVESAERRFFDAWVQNEQPPPSPKPAPVWRPQPAQQVIGLFPEPGAPG